MLYTTRYIKLKGRYMAHTVKYNLVGNVGGRLVILHAGGEVRHVPVREFRGIKSETLHFAGSGVLAKPNEPLVRGNPLLVVKLNKRGRGSSIVEAKAHYALPHHLQKYVSQYGKAINSVCVSKTPAVEHVALPKHDKATRMAALKRMAELWQESGNEPVDGVKYQEEMRAEWR